MTANEDLFKPGLCSLLQKNRHWIEGRTVGLVAHRASVTPDGVHAAEHLRTDPAVDLHCLFGPEHGYASAAGAGEQVPSEDHGDWDIPIYSLYGETRRPTSEMLDGIDVLVVDLQDLGIRCYTYASTLRHVLEAAASEKKTVVVADRPVPFPNTVDGPLLDEKFISFVGYVPTPLVYGMTPGETALFLQRKLNLDVDLKVARMTDYERSCAWPDAMPWVSPSPGIRSWETASCYPATVLAEAFGQIDYGRATDRVFRIIGIPGVKGNEMCDALTAYGLAGVEFAPETYQIAAGSLQGHTVTGIQISVTDPAAFRPVAAAVHILHEIQRNRGIDFLWEHELARPGFFDQLAGTDRLRKALQAGMPPDDIIDRWQADLQTFAESREPCLLY